MQANGWRAPEYNSLLLTREIKQQFSTPMGGSIDVASYFLDPYGASDWCSASHEDRYRKTFDDLPSGWNDWLASVIFRHLRTTPFLAHQIDVISMGVGDGRKETMLCEGLLRNRFLSRLRCFLLDISPTLLTEAHTYFTNAFAGQENIESDWILGNFYHLTRYSRLFYDPLDANILRVGCLLGGILGVIPHEESLIEQSLRAFKSGDLLLVDVCLGFAPPDNTELIQHVDPSFNSTHGLAWFEGVLRRNRPETQNVRFDFQLKRGISTLPNTYTIEILATIDEKAIFSMYRKHRYTEESLLKTFSSLGWKPIEGKHYGYLDRQLIYVFAKI